MSQFFYTPLVFQAGCNRYRDRMKEMDSILFPNSQRSLLDEDMSPEEADKATADALESRLHQGSVSGNLVFFARTFSDGKCSPDLAETVRNIILSIDDNRPLLEQGIRIHFGKGVRTTLLALFMGAGAAGIGSGAYLASKVLSKWPSFLEPVTDDTLNTTVYTANHSAAAKAVLLSQGSASAADIGASRSSGLWPVVLGAALIAVLGCIFYQKTAMKPANPSDTGDSTRDVICNKKQAYEVMKLVECLADIYRNER